MASQWQQKQMKMQDVLDQSINQPIVTQEPAVHNQSITNRVSFLVQQRLSDQL